MHLRIVGDGSGIGRSIYLVGLIAMDRRAPMRALRLFAAASTIGSLGIAIEPSERALFDATVATAHAALDEEVADSAWCEGKAMTLEQAITYALSAEADGD